MAGGFFLLQIGRCVEGGGTVTIYAHFDAIGIDGSWVFALSSRVHSELDSVGIGMSIASGCPGQPVSGRCEGVGVALMRHGSPSLSGDRGGACPSPYWEEAEDANRTFRYVGW